MPEGSLLKILRRLITCFAFPSCLASSVNASWVFFPPALTSLYVVRPFTSAAAAAAGGRGRPPKLGPISRVWYSRCFLHFTEVFSALWLGKVNLGKLIWGRNVLKMPFWKHFWQCFQKSGLEGLKLGKARLSPITRILNLEFWGFSRTRFAYFSGVPRNSSEFPQKKDQNSSNSEDFWGPPKLWASPNPKKLKKV